MTDSVLQTVALGPQWPTVDPFLFCAHHDDAYPAANADQGPAVSLAGRNLGMDFDGIDGWNMYHGSVVPGFPQHPHRGFETVTIVRTGLIDHSDSLGAAARFGRGDVQWLTAGRGIVHAEMFPLLDQSGPNPVELFQIWLNLPAADKMTDPYFTMIWDRDVPRVDAVDDAGRHTSVAVVAGRLDTAEPPTPPPNSWAAHEDADVAIWLIRMEAGATWDLPAPADESSVRTLYCFEGTTLDIDGTEIGANTAALVTSEHGVTLTAGPTEVECLVLQGRPIGEPVERYGPFVMNAREEIEQAFADYQTTQFGGWPWPTDDPVHQPESERFARHADGRTELG
ncbi:MAG: pirin family protein [Acidimicrobiia bacterium]|nr:pirin family protein [Acidimicrobiia bacterium]